MRNNRASVLRTIILILSLALAFFVLVPGQGPESNRSFPSANPAPPISVGTTAFLSDGGNAKVGVGADLNTLTALIQAGVAKDRKAYEALFNNERAFIVDDRVQVRVISLQEKTAEVRFLEGYHSEESGYVLLSWLKAARY